MAWGVTDPRVEKANHPGDAFGSNVGPTPRRIDPPKLALSVELSQRVEECPSIGARLERRPQIRLQVPTVRAFRRDDGVDDVACRDRTVAQRDREAQQPPPFRMLPRTRTPAMVPPT